MRSTVLAVLGFLLSSPINAQAIRFSNSLVQVTVTGRDDAFWTLASQASHRFHTFTAPVFPVEGKQYTAGLTHLHSIAEPAQLPNGVGEYRVIGEFSRDPSLSLELVFRIAPDSEVIRFRYVLHCTRPRQLTANGTADTLRYLSTSFGSLPSLTEVHLSEFNDLSHSYTEVERKIPAAGFMDGQRLMGPILVGTDGNADTLLVAYEHGSTVPDMFVQYRLTADREVALNATKGNYVPGQEIRDYETIWMDVASTEGGLDSAAKAFRDFVLRWMNPYPASRQPLIFYNTWNYQERNRWWNSKPYLASMTPDRILSEIDAAHRMGIEVFVIDTGWYEKTGDWQISQARFPNEMKAIRDRLAGYGMKLGLWFNPTAAAITSRAYLANKDCVMTWKGQQRSPRPIWETEQSYPMCLVSKYADTFADQLIRIAGQYGVRYFKWDAIDQYGCDSPDHFHGASTNSPQQRADSYAFQLPLAMARIVQKVTAAYPDAIVDFDVTERGRAFGLSFLSSGKYFLINNGPYAFNYDIPIDKKSQNWNLFFYPGPARTWICRLPLPLDHWIPSVLLLTHYFPDDPQSSQLVNIGSLILGQDGIWGDLPKVSSEGVQLIATLLSKYKQVREEMAASFPLRSGAVAGMPEIYEKLSGQTGRGGVVLFSPSPGEFTYITRQRAATAWWATPGTHVRFDASGHAIVTANIDEGASIVFFGAN